MSLYELDQLRAKLHEAQEAGHEILPLEDVLLVAEAARRVYELSPKYIEDVKVKASYKLEWWKIRHQYRFGRHQIDLSAVLEAGLSAIRGVLTINGGAAVSLLAFFGAVLGKGGDVSPLLVHGLGNSLKWFLWGVAAAALCAGLRYLSEFARVVYRPNVFFRFFRRTNWFVWMAFAAWLMSLLCFLWGGWLSYEAVTSRPALLTVKSHWI